MSEYGFTKKDWVLFREKIADWQEAYMDKLNKEYIELLNGEGTPSEKFWTLEESHPATICKIRPFTLYPKIRQLGLG